MPEPRREPVCDKPGCGKPATGYDAWGEWCDDHNGGLEPAGRPIDHAKTIRRALDHLPDAECYGPASLLTWAEEGIAALAALVAERDETESLAAMHDGRAQSLATEVERLEALEREQAARIAELEAAFPQHASDCATNNEPALPRGDCDCRPDPGDPAAVIAYYTHLVAGLLAERQQDKQRIERLETALTEIGGTLSRWSESLPAGTQHQLAHLGRLARAALAVEEDATK